MEKNAKGSRYQCPNANKSTNPASLKSYYGMGRTWSLWSDFVYFVHSTFFQSSSDSRVRPILVARVRALWNATSKFEGSQSISKGSLDSNDCKISKKNLNVQNTPITYYLNLWIYRAYLHSYFVFLKYLWYFWPWFYIREHLRLWQQLSQNVVWSDLDLVGPPRCQTWSI